jgi:hypothetical protein
VRCYLGQDACVKVPAYALEGSEIVLGFTQYATMHEKGGFSNISKVTIINYGDYMHFIFGPACKMWNWCFNPAFQAALSGRMPMTHTDTYSLAHELKPTNYAGIEKSIEVLQAQANMVPESLEFQALVDLALQNVFGGYSLIMVNRYLGKTSYAEYIGPERLANVMRLKVKGKRAYEQEFQYEELASLLNVTRIAVRHGMGLSFARNVKRKENTHDVAAATALTGLCKLVPFELPPVNSARDVDEEHRVPLEISNEELPVNGVEGDTPPASPMREV